MKTIYNDNQAALGAAYDQILATVARLQNDACTLSALAEGLEVLIKVADEDLSEASKRKASNAANVLAAMVAERADALYVGLSLAERDLVNFKPPRAALPEVDGFMQ